MICSFATRLIESITSRSAHAAGNPSFKFECLAKPNSRGQAGRQTDRQTNGLSRNRLYIEFILVLISGDSSRVNWRDETHLAINKKTLFSAKSRRQTGARPIPSSFAPPIGPLPHLAPFSPRPPFSSPPIPFIASTGWPADLPRDPSRPGSLQSERNEKPSPLRFLQLVGRAAKTNFYGKLLPTKRRNSK